MTKLITYLFQRFCRHEDVNHFTEGHWAVRCIKCGRVSPGIDVERRAA